MREPPFDASQAHRWFAIELNNVAWDLVEAPSRSSEQTEQMIHAAHASVFHWLAIGKPINQLRGQCLLATVYAAAGLAETALRHAARCVALCDEQPEGLGPFDRATAAGCMANALACAGRMEEARQQHAQAATLAGALEEADDRAVFDRLYPAR